MKEEQLDIFNQYRYHLRYRNGDISKGYYNTFEKAIHGFNQLKHSGIYGGLYSDLMDVVTQPLNNNKN